MFSYITAAAGSLNLWPQFRNDGMNCYCAGLQTHVSWEGNDLKHLADDGDPRGKKVRTTRVFNIHPEGEIQNCV